MDALTLDGRQDDRPPPEPDDDRRPLRSIDHLIAAPPDPDLVAAVVVPVRNEADALPGLIEALARQRTVAGDRFPRAGLELIMLFSDCHDASPEIAVASALCFPGLRLHAVDLGGAGAGLPVGMARRLLMDAAGRRLDRVAGAGVILTTDADTVPAPDWLAQTLRAVAAGADAVGGQVLMKPHDRATLPPPLLRRYLFDHAYQRLVSRLEGLVDPEDDDPLPRHHQHAGASLAATVGAYRRAGGMPPLATGEDEAFFRALKRSGARFRHSVEVRTFTSGRLEGRVDKGLAGTLRHWHEHQDDAMVPAPEAVLARIERRARLRALHRAAAPPPEAVEAVALECGIEPAWLARRLARPAPFFLLQEALEAPAPAPDLVPLVDAVHRLRRLIEVYEGARSRRSSRQVAARLPPQWQKPAASSANSWT